MKLNPMLAGLRMTQAERSMGRFMRAPDGHEGTPAGVQNNGESGGQGNSGDSASGAGDSNNTGTGFDPVGFWNSPAPADGSAPSGESAGNTGGESGTGGGDQNQFAQQLTQQLSSLTFDPVFDQGIADQINEGNYQGVQERLNAMGQQIVRNALALNVQILRPFADQILERVRQETQQTFQSRDNQESLVTLFPAAKNPAMERMIRPIYDQALKNNQGNREKAVSQTKEMLRYMAGESASDLGIEIAPRGEGDRGGPTPNFNWLDELTGRK